MRSQSLTPPKTQNAPRPILEASIGDIIMTAFIWLVIAIIVTTLGTAAIICALAQKMWKLADGQHKP